jgi:type III secretion system low calcium response chaperone LcrH/SycD
MSQLYPLPSNDDDPEITAENNDGLTEALIDNILTSVTSGTTLKDMYGISDQMMDVLYAHAYDFYQKGKLDDALFIFQFLYTHDIYNPTYIMGLAAMHQQKKNYAKAVEFYVLAYELNNKKSLALLYAGQCHLFLKDKEQAKVFFSEFLKSDAQESFKRQARAYLGALQPVQESGVTHG